MPFGKAGSSRAFGAPSRYIQGPGELRNLPSLVKVYGSSAFILIDSFFFSDYAPLFQRLFKDQNLSVICEKFSGECCDSELLRLKELVEAAPPRVFIGIGGGKACDTIKGLADFYDGIVFVCPTALSTDAPTSVHSVVYRKDHSYYLMVHKKNPDLVLVDTAVAINATPRMFAAGMGDALATYLEARSCKESGNVNNVGSGYQQTLLGGAIAKLSFDVLMARGRDAYLAACNHIRTEAFEDVAEANTLLSGVGFENTGCSIAHGLQASFSAVQGNPPCMHGEQVAFGALCQMVLENRPSEEFQQIYHFCLDVGLPVSLAQMGISENIRETVESVVDYGLKNKAILQIEPFSVTRERLINAILYVDAYSQQHP